MSTVKADSCCILKHETEADADTRFFPDTEQDSEKLI